MAKTAPLNPERLADGFVTYLFKTYKGTRHVRRVASWIGMLLLAIQNVAGASLQKNRARQVVFAYRGHWFKAKYSHSAGTRGGIDFIEVLPGRGSPEGELAVRVTSLADAEDVYRTLKARLDKFLRVS